MSEEGGSPLLDHLEDMRRTLVHCLLVIAAGSLVAFACYQPIIDWFTAPLHQMQSSGTDLVVDSLVTSRVVNRNTKEQQYVLPPNIDQVISVSKGVEEVYPGKYRMPPGSILVYSAASRQALVVLGPLEGMSIALKTAFWVGVACTAPLWGLFVARFVAPGLRRSERRAAGAFLAVSAAFIALGAAFAYHVTIPAANAYLSQFNAGIGENWWTLRNYLDYTLFLLASNAVAFQCGVVGLFAVHYGMITAQFLAHYRRHAIVVAFVLGALLTPPDIVTQLMLAAPLMVLYELVILYARARENFLRLRVPDVN